MPALSALGPGLALILALSSAAFALAQVGLVQHYGLGPLTLAILFGTLLGNARPAFGEARFRPGLQFVQRRCLRAGVALYGFNLSVQQIVEVGNLAADRAGGSVDVILNLARHLDRLGYEWVAFTATRELIGIFRRLGLPPLALAPADPDRLGADAADWGSYYDSRPIVVAGRIALALEMVKRHG